MKVFFIIGFLVFVLGFNSVFGLANPASVFCIESGYNLETRTRDDGGQIGVCIFPDGSECGQWDYYCKCDPQGTGCWEDEFDCDYPCGELECKGPGEEALISECCEGLDGIIPAFVYTDDCGKMSAIGWTKICTDCGNGVCEEWESECNCPEDCGKPSKISNFFQRIIETITNFFKFRTGRFTETLKSVRVEFK